LPSGLEWDSHKHDLVKFSHQWIDIETKKILYVQIKQPSSNANQNEVVDITNGCVEVLETSYGDGIWHIEWHSHVYYSTL